MKNILATIGIVTIVIAIFYFAIYSPVKKYNELQHENVELQKSLAEFQEEHELIYAKFDEALRTHLNDSTVQEIYSDTRFFIKSDSEISVNECKTTYTLNSYNRL